MLLDHLSGQRTQVRVPPYSMKVVASTNYSSWSRPDALLVRLLNLKVGSCQNVLCGSKKYAKLLRVAFFSRCDVCFKSKKKNIPTHNPELEI